MSYLRIPLLLNRWSFQIIYTAVALIAIVYLALTFLSAGSAPLFVFLRNDILNDSGRIVFLLGFPVAFLISLLAITYTLKLPRFDFFNRIITINLITYSGLGLLLSVLRINLFSRTVFLSEILLTTILLVVFHILRHRLYPRRLGILPNIDIDPFQTYPGLQVISITNEIPNTQKLDGVIADLHKQSDKKTSHFLSHLAEHRILVYDASALIETLWGRISLVGLTTIEIDGFSPPEFYSSIKRALEIIVVFALSPLLAITFAAISIAIKLDSPGPIYFQQKRIGRFGAHFTIFKFRSMYYSKNVSDVLTVEQNDKRVTRVGRFLRRMRLDELPQFWNVINGTMGIIGPRPEQLELTARFNQTIPLYRFRHVIRPGITGWAQVMFGYVSSYEQTRMKLQYDFFYIKHMSPWLDFVIVTKTIRVILLGSGSR